MSAITEARQALAEAVSTTGIQCLPYAPEAVSETVAFVDTIQVDYTLGASFCLGQASGQLLTVGLRHDKAGSTIILEELVPSIVRAVEAIDGVRVMAVESGSVEFAGTVFPAILYSLAFALTG